MSGSDQSMDAPRSQLRPLQDMVGNKLYIFPDHFPALTLQAEELISLYRDLLLAWVKSEKQEEEIRQFIHAFRQAFLVLETAHEISQMGKRKPRKMENFLPEIILNSFRDLIALIEKWAPESSSEKKFALASSLLPYFSAEDFEPRNLQMRLLKMGIAVSSHQLNQFLSPSIFLEFTSLAPEEILEKFCAYIRYLQLKVIESPEGMGFVRFEGEHPLEQFSPNKAQGFIRRLVESILIEKDPKKRKYAKDHLLAYRYDVDCFDVDINLTQEFASSPKMQVTPRINSLSFPATPKDIGLHEAMHNKGNQSESCFYVKAFVLNRSFSLEKVLDCMLNEHSVEGLTLRQLAYFRKTYPSFLPPKPVAALGQMVLEGKNGQLFPLHHDPDQVPLWERLKQGFKLKVPIWSFQNGHCLDLVSLPLDVEGRPILSPDWLYPVTIYLP